MKQKHTLYRQWIKLIKTRTLAVSVVAGLCLAGLLLVQVYYISVTVVLEERKFSDEMNSILLEVHHSLEQDPAASQRLINLFRQFERQQPLSPELKDSVLAETSLKIDSVLQAFNREDASFNFAYYATARQKVVISDRAGVASAGLFKQYSERAGYPVRAALGKGQYRFGIYFPSEMWLVLERVWWLLSGSLLFVGLVTLLFFSILATVREEKQLSELKNSFINNLAHELKTPVFASSLIHKIARRNLQKGNLHTLAEQLKLLEMENHDLKAKVEKVLQLAQLDHSKAAMKFADTDLHVLVEKSVQLYQPVVAEKSGRITCHLQAAMHCLPADQVHLGNLLGSLLDNSVKYCTGAPRIQISTRNADGGILLSVEDNGEGILPAEQERVFDKFYRAGHGDLHQVKGFGLGLSYVKLVAEAHRARIEINSQPGGGTAFHIHFPNIFTKNITHAFSKNTVNGR